MKINYFECVTSRTPRVTTLDALVQSIRSSEALKSRTEAYRQLLRDDKDKAAQLKKQFAGFLPAALVNDRRARANVIALTGLVMVDFDHVPAERLDEVRRKINEDKHTVLSYVTLSGEGLRVLAAYRPPTPTENFDLKAHEREYRDMFTGINQYYSQLTGLEFDPACKDLSRLSFAAFDDEVYYQPEAKLFTTKELEIATPDDKKEKRKERSRKNKAFNRIHETYLRKIKPMLARDGVEYAPGAHNNYVMRVGYQFNKYGFELADAQEWAAKEFADYADAAQVIKWCYERVEEHGEWKHLKPNSPSTAEDNDGKMRHATRIDIINFLNEKLEMRRNLVLGITEIRWKNPMYEGIDSPHSRDRRAFSSLTDDAVESLCTLMEMERNLDASQTKMNGVLMSDLVQEYDPLSSYLNSLPEWEAEKNPDYLAELADSVQILDDNPAATDLWKRCLKKWFVAMLVGWTEREKGNQTVLTFIGAQGTYKSTWMMNLMPPQLREYFKTKQNSGDLNKDDIIAMSRYGLILHEELDAMSTKENNHMKSIVTAKNSDERAAYHRHEKRRINIASLCATGNNEHFLSNDQGTRRMLVFRVQVVKPPIDFPFNYEGIYSQAYTMLKDGFQYYFNPEEQAELEAHNKQFEVISREEELISLWIRKPEDWETPLWMRPAQIAELISARSHGNARFDVRQIGAIMKELGFEKCMRQGKPGYKVMVREYDDVLRHQKELAMMPEETSEPLALPEVKDIDKE